MKEFENQKDTQAILVSGRGGIGKSRLLKAWAESINKSVAVRFVSSGTNIEAKVLELLPNGFSYLVIDDAHDRDDISVILNGVVRTRPEMKIVLISRPYGISKLEDELARSGVVYDSDKVIKLDDLDVKDTEELAREILTDPDVNGDKGLARKIAEITNDCPLATVVGSHLVGKRLIKPELLNNEKKFRDELLRSFRDVIAGEIGGQNPEKICQLLDFLATIQPFSPSDPKFRAAAEKILTQHFDTVIRDVGNLEEAGVLLRRGNHLRVVPDLLADYIRFDASYDEKNGRPTGYVDRVFEHLQDDLAMRLLINISQLDWRLSADNVQSMLLDAIWKKIFSEIQAANNADRCFILKKLKDAAYYQPKQFLELVEYVKDNPSKTPEDPKFSGLYKYEHKDVLKELPEILRRMCYHLDYLPHCVDLIWELGRGDSRRTNQFPEHGMRILQELTQYDVYELTGKSVEVNQLMLEAVKRWLSDPNLVDYVHSPLDVLDELLDKDSATDTYDKGKITIRSFGVHYENTKQIREEVLSLVVGCAKSPALKISLRAIKSLGHALEEPRALYGRKVGSDESTKWKPFQISVLDEIESIVKVQKNPIIYIELKDILAWHAQYSPSKDIKNRARLVFDSLSTFFEVRLIQAVGQIWDREWSLDEEKYDHQKIMEMSLAFRQEVAKEFVKKYPDIKEGFVILEKLLGELENCQKNPFPILFFTEMAKLYPGYVEGLCDKILKNQKSPLTKHFGYLIFGLIEKDQNKSATFIRDALKTGDEKLCVSVADYYWRGKWIDYYNEEFDLPNMRQLLGSKYGFAKKLSLGSLGRFGKVKTDVTKQLLLSVDLEEDKDLASEYCQQFDKEHDFDPDLLSDKELEAVLEKFERTNDIDDHYIEEFLSYAGGRLPLIVVKLLLKRIELSKITKKGEKYQPLSYSSRTLLQGFSNTSHYADVLREVRNKIVEKNWQTRFWIPKLFKSLSNNFDDTGVQVLLEWVLSGEKEKLEGVNAIIEDAPENFIFKNPDFVSKMLLAAKPYGQDVMKLTRSALAHSAIFRSKHGTPGQPMPEDVELKENSEKMMANFLKGSPEYELFESLLKHANWEIEDQLKRDEELLE